MFRTGNVMSVKNGFIDCIGNTPLIRLNKASDETGCTILGKAEFLNPGGSVKDRAALGIIRDAERNGLLKPGGTIVEGTAGNTGIGLTLLAKVLGYESIIVMPETQSQEKKDTLRLCGADLRLVPAVPYKDPGNYVKYSERLAKELSSSNGKALYGQTNSITCPTLWRIMKPLAPRFGSKQIKRLMALCVQLVRAEHSAV